ncbi:MAG: VIT and VWA domain-containing protein [Candidatus Acidiferrum sp.]
MSMKTGFGPLFPSTGETIKLSMQKLWLTGQVLAMGARLSIRHEFVSQDSKALEVVYGFVLPRDASLRRFRITGDDFSVDSELRPTEAAHKLYEKGILAGSLSSLARQYGDGLVNLTVGNIRPGEKVAVLLEMLAGVELHDESLRLRFPFTLAPSYHAQARGIEISPGLAELELPGEQFDDLILPQFAKDASHLHQIGFCLDVQMAGTIQELASPSHAIRVESSRPESSRVSLARERDVPNRDLVLDVRCKSDRASVFGGVDSSGNGRFAAVIPSTHFGQVDSQPRRLVILLDRSGSMEGTPIAQAKKAIEACLGALDAHDLFGLVAFSSGSSVFRLELAKGSIENRQQAREFLQGIDSGGGTELADGLAAAAKLLGDKPGDILIITDGQVFGTEAILERARSTGVRIHCLGIGSASQDRFLAQLAAHTGGVTRFLTPSERVDLPAVELFASIGRPVAENVIVSIDGPIEWQILPAPSRFVFSGTPLLVTGEITSATTAQLKVSWKAAQTEAHSEVPISMSTPALGNTLKSLQGSRILSDLESRKPRALLTDLATRKEIGRLRSRLQELSSEYGLASSEMSLVAVVKRPGDTANEIPKTRIVLVGFPMDMEWGETLASGAMLARASAKTAFRARFFSSLRDSFDLGSSTSDAQTSRSHSIFGPLVTRKPKSEPVPAPPLTVDDVLIILAGMLQPDGGMPGKTQEIRVANSLASLLCFVSQGNTSQTGPFRVHVTKLLQYLNSDLLKQLDPAKSQNASRALDLLALGRSLPGDWLQHCRRITEMKEMDLSAFWQQLAETVRAA